MPNVTNNQTNDAGVQTIQASDLTISTVSLAAGNLNQGSVSNVIYIAKIDAATEPISITNLLFNLTGTYDNDDLGILSIYFNKNSPSLSGASLANNLAANFAGPHAVNFPASIDIPAGTTLYLILTANITSAANDGHTVNINGATDPISIIGTTVPNITNNQTNDAGIQTIRGAGITLSTVNLPATNIVPGTNSNIIYAVKMEVGTEPVMVTSIQLPLAGTYDDDDLGSLSVLYNATMPTNNGAVLVNNAATNFSGPHVFSISAPQSIGAGTTGYFIFTVNVNSSATINNTVSVNGGTDPAVFGFTTAPGITNNQSNLAGVFKISNLALPLTLTSFTAQAAADRNQVQLNWVTASETNTSRFDIEWSTNGASFVKAGSVAAQGSSQTDKSYAFLHSAPAAGTNFYRLKMIDIDGQFSYSPVVNAQLVGSQRSMIIAPNPVGATLRLVMNNREPVKALRIFDMSGKLRWQSGAIVNTGIVLIPVGILSVGYYNVEVSTQNGVERLPFIKTGK